MITPYFTHRRRKKNKEKDWGKVNGYLDKELRGNGHSEYLSEYPGGTVRVPSGGYSPDCTLMGGSAGLDT